MLLTLNLCTNVGYLIFYAVLDLFILIFTSLSGEYSVRLAETVYFLIFVKS